MSHTVHLLPVSSSVQHVIMMEYEPCNLHVELMCFLPWGAHLHLQTCSPGFNPRLALAVISTAVLHC